MSERWASVATGLLWSPSELTITALATAISADGDRRRPGRGPAAAGSTAGARATPASHEDGPARLAREAGGGPGVELGGELGPRIRAQRRAAPRPARCRPLKAFIACLPQLGDGSVEPGAGVRLGQPEHGGDLGVGEAGEELERDQLALGAARASPARRRRRAGARSARRRSAAGGDASRRRARSPARPAGRGGGARRGRRCGRSRRARPAARRGSGSKRRALAVGALEGGRGDLLGRGAVAEQPGRVGVDVVAARAVEALEGEVGLARGVPRRLRQASDSRPYYGRARDPSQRSIGSGGPGWSGSAAASAHRSAAAARPARAPPRSSPPVISSRRRRSPFGDRERRHQHDRVAERADDRAAPARLERHPVADAQRRVVLAEVDADHEAAAADLGDLGHRRDLVEQLAEQPDLRLQAQRSSAPPRRRRGWRAPPRRRAGCRCRCGRGRRCAAPRARRGSPRRCARWPGSRRAACSRRSGPWRGRAGRARPAPARRRTSSRCGRSRSRPRRRSAAPRSGRRARAPRAGSRAGGRASRPRPGPAARRSPRRSPLRGRRGCARGGRRRRARRCGPRRAAAGRRRGRGRCRRPRPSRSCRRGRRGGGGRRRCGGCAGRRAAAGTGRPSSGRSRSRSSPSPSRRRARGPAGAISTRRAASSAAPGWERPSIVEWATLPSCVADRLVDPGVAVAVDVAPERGDPVEVAAALGVDQVGALGPLDHQRLFLAPALLLGERVPEVVAVELSVIHRHRRRH